MAGETDPLSGILDATDPLIGANTGMESSLSNWVGPYVTEMLGMGQALAQSPYPSYEGILTAPISSLQDQAFQGIAGLSVPNGMSSAADLALGVGYEAGNMSYDPNTFTSGYQATPYSTDYTPGAFDDINYTPTDFAGEIGRWTDAGVAESYMNPFLQLAMTPELAEIRRQADITRLNDAQRLSAAGAYGGSRQGIMESELNDNTLRLMDQIVGSGYRDAYNTGSNIFKSDEDRRLEALGLGDRSNQFGANLQLDTQRAAEQAKQFGSTQSMEAQRQYDLARQFQDRQQMEADRLGEQSSQFAANFGKDLLGTQLDASQQAGALYGDEFDAALRLLQQQKAFGDTERLAIQQGLDADKQQFEYESMWPYKQVQFMQSLLQGLPLEAQQQYYQQPSSLSQFGSAAGGITDLLQQIFGTDTVEGDVAA